MASDEKARSGVTGFRLKMREMASSARFQLIGRLFKTTAGNGQPDNEGGRKPLFVSPELEEEYQRIRANLLAAGNGQGPRAFVVAGSVSGEGATTTAALLAMTLAAEGPTLLVDGNLRTPAVSELFETGNAYGLGDILANETPLGACLRETDTPGLWVLPAGARYPKPAQLFTGPAFGALVGQLKRRFTFVVFDSPPLSAYSEGVYMAAKVDGVILVVHAEKTPVEVVYRGKVQLERGGARILGALLTQKKEYVPQVILRWISP